MSNWNNEQSRLNDLDSNLAIIHIYCLLVLLSGLIISRKIVPNDIFPIMNIRVFVFLGFLCIMMVLIYISRLGSQHYSGKIRVLIISFYVIFPMFIAIAALIFIGDNLFYSETILLVPIVISASTGGKKIGVAVALICSITLLCFKINYLTITTVVKAIESNFILINIMFLVGWYIGVLTDSRAVYEGLLKKNLKDLEDEIAKREQMEKEVSKLNRLNIVGEMAAGIGHEIRNPLTTVRGFLQLLGEKYKYASEKEFFNLMIEELDRANFIITEFLTMAKNKPVNKEIKNFNQILIAILPLLTAEAVKRDILIKTEFGNVPDLLLDEKEIRQVIYNLVINGMEAMPSGGVLTIRTFIDAGEIVLSVQDEGKGIETDILEKLGTPFFTTKDNGTGLGLAQCYSIASRHNAAVEVNSSQSGSTFNVRFKMENGDLATSDKTI